MASSSDNISMAVFCDFENVALGVRDANYEKFDIKPVLERLLLKGSIVVKKAYCDWDRYKGFKSAMHEANFEMIEIPHVRQSGKNSADIRLVVDALDLCYTKSHVDTFVIISGDSDFSPLVSKLRENAKKVIGVGVKQSTSDLLVANCDEFIFYDDLVREVRRAAAKRDERKTQPAARGKSPDEGNRRKEESEARKAQAIELVVEMFDALVSERGDSGKIWASLLKDTLKRRRPDFNETFYGFRTFGNLLEEAQNRGMLEFGRDEKSGAYVYRSSAATAAATAADNASVAQEVVELIEEATPAKESRRRGGRGRKPAPVMETPADAPEAPEELVEAVAEASAEAAEPVAVEPEPVAAPSPAPAKAKRQPAPARTRKAAAKKAEAVVPAAEAPIVVEAPAEAAADEAKPSKPARKTAPRSRRPAKPKAAPENA
ncbi:NYN domain-containing protein [Massilia soli]|uniref:NYN domain-containing protein n=1 Tax=Massilia soli TaxID=2792854 RepID=A0ABS7SQK5_9BURK|nr:NYN domain-containing protein [Massilia soli]MBZ2208218.1 NYN domain-containing protein [Massilia soli]